MSHNRRGLVGGLFAALGALVVSGCDRIASAPSVRDFLIGAQGLSRRSQRLLQGRMALAQEFDEADIAPSFRPNGETMPSGDAYKALHDSGFKDFRLVVDGLVERPLSLSLDQLRAMPGRTQITRHDCVEGWSCIGKWSGVKLGPLLDLAGLKPGARFIVFHCADLWGGPAGVGTPYYESIDLYDAYHPQTILAHNLNGGPLPVANGAPLRLRVERQLGYKQAKYVMRIEATDSLANIGRGRGGYWEDNGYEWYGGI